MRHLVPLLAAAASVLSTAAAYADLGDQLFKLLPDDGAEFDNFGVSVAISGTTAIVGAERDDDNGGSSGSAYLFDTTTGQQIAKLLADDGAEADLFGISVAISGATAIVGAYEDDDNGPSSGSAYLFDTTTGRQIAKLLPDDGAANDWFGFSVAISGATAIVGAVLDDDNGFWSGSAYLFDISDPANPVQTAKLLADDGAANDVFGRSVAISGATAIVGAFGGNSAYLFDTTTGRQLFKLLADDGAANDWFGFSVAISGATAIVGAYFDDDNGFDSGSAYLFDTTTGVQIAKLLADDGAEFDNFGVSVGISGATAIVGAHQDDDNGGWSGSAYLFDTTTGDQIAKLLPDDGAALDEFGRSVAISGAVAIVGAWHDADNGRQSGSAYLFDAAGTPACPWDLDASGSVGILDLLALLAVWGTDPGGPPDFDGDGTVGILDLLALLANWGPCPPPAVARWFGHYTGTALVTDSEFFPPGDYAAEVAIAQTASGVVGYINITLDPKDFLGGIVTHTFSGALVAGNKLDLKYSDRICGAGDPIGYCYPHFTGGFAQYSFTGPAAVKGEDLFLSEPVVLPDLHYEATLPFESANLTRTAGPPRDTFNGKYSNLEYIWMGTALFPLPLPMFGNNQVEIVDGQIIEWINNGDNMPLAGEPGAVISAWCFDDAVGIGWMNQQGFWDYDWILDLAGQGVSVIVTFDGPAPNCAALQDPLEGDRLDAVHLDLAGMMFELP